MLRLLILYMTLLIQFMLQAQEVSLSVPVKFPSKLNDFEILGKNENGIFLHYFSNSKNEVEVFTKNLRPVIRREIDLKNKNTRIESVFLRESGGVVFYSRNDQSVQYLEAKRLSGNLYLSNDAVILDSIVKNKTSGFEPFYIKQSPNRKYFLVFTIYDYKGSFSVKYSVFDEELEYVSSGVFENNQKNIVLKSFKVSDSGIVHAVMARYSKQSEISDYGYDELYTFSYNAVTGFGSQQVSKDEGYMFKNIITEIDPVTDRVFTAANYINSNNKIDLGFVILSTNLITSSHRQFKYPFSQENMEKMTSYTTKSWLNQALIIKPKKIIPQSDEGCLIILESQYRTTRVVRDIPGMYSYPYMYDNTFNTRVFDQNHYFDITAVSISGRGEVNWTVVMPKKQVTEGDGGLYSSFMLFESNNLLKFLFNEDIYTSGNFIEYNINSAGEMLHLSILNSEREQFIPIPQKGIQISPTEVIIPSEQKRDLQLLLLKY